MANVDIGKNIATTRLSDGSVLNLFNSTVVKAQTINFKDIDNQIRYTLVLDQTSFQKKYRCACYSRSFPQSTIDTQVRYLLVLPNSGKNVQPLYEFISPSILNLKQDMIQISWWSNVYANKFQDKYDVNALVRFSSSELVIDESIKTYKILCTSVIRWEYLKQDTTGDNYHKLIPIIDTPIIVAVIKDQGYVVDFETGTGSGSGSGSGGGIGIHSHTSNDDGGFASAVFMPSAHLRPISWK